MIERRESERERGREIVGENGRKGGKGKRVRKGKNEGGVPLSLFRLPGVR